MNTDPLQAIIRLLKGVKQLSNGSYQALCPAHDDHNPSLSISCGKEGRVLMCCHSVKCDIKDILSAIGKELKDLYPNNGRVKQTKRVLVKRSYDYTDENGVLLFQVCRSTNKKFVQRKPDGNGGWTYSLNGVRRVLYELPRLADISADSFVYVVEGEKDADRLINEGMFATTNSQGAGKWKLCDDSPLHGHHIIILPDNDNAGRKHAEDVATRLHSKAKSIRILALPDLPDKGDVSDWLDNGGDIENLYQLAENAPEWEPSQTKATARYPVKDIAVEEGDSQLRMVCMADVSPERVKWLWRNRFPLGKLSIVAGVQGLGKTFVLLDMAARISAGNGWPDEPDQPIKTGSTIILSLEDDLGDTLRPRLDAAGANVNKIYAVQGVQEVDEVGERTFCATEDIILLEQLIDDLGDVRLIIVDPLTGYIGSKTDAYRDNEVRAALSPLGDLAAKANVSIVGIMHLRKSPSDQAMFRVLGSVAFTAYARACWLIGEDRNDSNYRLMLPVKMNVAKAAPGLRFQIVEPGRVEWDDQPVHMTADEAFSGTAEHPDEAGTKVADAEEWLKSALANGAQTAKEIKKQAAENCITERTLERAKSRLNVVSTNKGVFGNAWFWMLPNE